MSKTNRNGIWNLSKCDFGHIGNTGNIGHIGNIGHMDKRNRIEICQNINLVT